MQIMVLMKLYRYQLKYYENFRNRPNQNITVRHTRLPLTVGS